MFNHLPAQNGNLDFLQYNGITKKVNVAFADLERKGLRLVNGGTDTTYNYGKI